VCFWVLLLFYKFTFKWDHNYIVVMWAGDWRDEPRVVSWRRVPATYLEMSWCVSISWICVCFYVVHSDSLIIVRSFVLFSLQSNVRRICKYATDFWELNCEKLQSGNFNETDVLAEYMCFYWIFCQLFVNINSALLTLCCSSVSKPAGITKPVNHHLVA
jgi:hypothetical protein